MGRLSWASVVLAMCNLGLLVGRQWVADFKARARAGRAAKHANRMPASLGLLTDTAAEGIGHVICADACVTSFGAEEAAQMRESMSMSARVPCGAPPDVPAPHAPTTHAP